MTDILQSLTDVDFKAEALKPGTRVLVDFWAPWCPPCIGIGKHLEQKAASYTSKLKIVKVNADEAVETSSTYNVRGLPTLLLFKDGQPVDTRLGAMSAAKLDELLEKWSNF